MFANITHRGKGKILGHALLFLGILLVIPVALFLFEATEISPWLVLAVHSTSALVLAAGFYILTSREYRQFKRDNIWWIFAMAACLLIPLYGALCVICIYVIQGIRKHTPPPVVSDEITVQSPEVFGKPISRARQLEILDRLDIEPFVDIFRRGQQELKKSAVKFLGDIRTRSALRTLNRALMDQDVEIRLYAAGVLGIIDDEYAKEIDTRRARMAESPGDVESALSLVEIYVAYARSGLIESISQEYYFDESIRVLERFRGDDRAEAVMARCYYELEKYDEARGCATRCLKSSPENRECNELLCEILFIQRDFDELAGRIQSLKDHDPPLIRPDVTELWT